MLYLCLLRSSECFRCARLRARQREETGIGAGSRAVLITCGNGPLPVQHCPRKLSRDKPWDFGGTVLRVFDAVEQGVTLGETETDHRLLWRPRSLLTAILTAQDAGTNGREG